MKYEPPNYESMIHEVVRYQSSDGEIFNSKIAAMDYQEQCHRSDHASSMLKEGYTVAECLRAVGWEVFDPILEKLTKNSKLSIPHWQCRDDPGYQPERFRWDRELLVFGDAGSWSGAYGNYTPLRDVARYAKNKDSIL